MINEILDNIRQRLSDAFSWIPDYFFLTEYFVIGIVLLVVAVALNWFFGGLPVIGKWISGITGFVVFCYGFFLAGIVVAFNRFRKERVADHEKIRDLQKKQKPPSDRGWFG